MRGGIAMTYYALTFLACERQRQIAKDYLRAKRREPLRMQLGFALVAFGTRLLQEKKLSP
jgi:hypothetical protein